MRSVAGALALLLAAGLLVVGATSYGQTPAPGGPGFVAAPPFFTGTAFIQNLPANSGTSIVVLGAIGSSKDYQLCGTGAVGQAPPGAPSTWSAQPGNFTVLINASQAACVSPATTYNFYVNAVWAGTQGNSGLTAKGGAIIGISLSAPLAAAASVSAVPPQSTNQFFYVFGQVIDKNQAPADGVTVNVVADQNQQCAGQGKSFDLTYTSTAMPSQPITKPGFFIAPVSAGGQTIESCGNLLDLYLNGVKLQGWRSFNSDSPSSIAVDVGTLQLPY